MASRVSEGEGSRAARQAEEEGSRIVQTFRVADSHTNCIGSHVTGEW